MKIRYYLAAILIICGLSNPALSQEQATLTINVHNGALDGTALEGVYITGTDASGSEFSQVTDSDGVAVVSGEPGVWQFTFAKAGYNPLYLTYNATQDEQTAAYLEKNEDASLITLAVYVHDSDLNGELLSGVQIDGTDGSGNEFSGVTDSSGVAAITGEPGIWLFEFQKTDYDILSLKYNATVSEETAVYLDRSA